MALYPLSFVEVHGPVFMMGSNLGNKINAAQRGAKLLMDDTRGVVWIHFKGKTSFIPLANIASADAIELPEEIKAFFMVIDQPASISDTGPMAVKRGRGRPPTIAAEPSPDFDPNDDRSHVDAVRYASANSHKVSPAAMTDSMIQESRMQAMGIKMPMNTKTQVQSAHQVGNDVTTANKKILSHEALKAKMDAEK